MSFEFNAPLFSNFDNSEIEDYFLDPEKNVSHEKTENVIESAPVTANDKDKDVGKTHVEAILTEIPPAIEPKISHEEVKSEEPQITHSEELESEILESKEVGLVTSHSEEVEPVTTPQDVEPNASHLEVESHINKCEEAKPEIPAQDVEPEMTPAQMLKAKISPNHSENLESNKSLIHDSDVKKNQYAPTQSAPKSRQTPRKQTLPQAPVRQSPRLAAIAKSIRRSNASRGFLPSQPPNRNHRRSISEGSAIVSRFAKVEKRQTPQRKVAVVRPSQTNTRKGEKNESIHNQSVLSNDEVDALNQTTQFRNILAQNRHRASVIQGPLRPGSQRPKAGPLKPTKPVEFKFATSARVKKAESSIDLTESAHSSKSSASSSSATSNQPKRPTKVQPFNLHEPTKQKETAKPFVSMAELSLKFHTKTPQRFRTKRYNANEPLPEVNKRARNNSGGITKPQTPQLSTRLRARTVDHPTREQIEDKELEEAQKHKFKARPLNKKILTEPQIKPAETAKISTIPEPFDITDSRKEEASQSVKTLMASARQLMSSESLASIPHGGLSTTWEKRTTQIKPFSFDTRDLETIRKKKEKIQKAIDEEKKLAEFHAHPMPMFDGVKGLPPKKPPTPTKIEPFNLLSDHRGSAKQQSLQKELEALEEMERKQRQFEAQPDTVIHKEPFIPQKSKKPLTDISGFSLNTEKRAEEREAYDAHLKEKEDELMARKLELEERKRKEEEAEVQTMRKAAVHKAQPVRHFKPVEVKQGVTIPTQPISPNFETDRRLRERAVSKQNINSDMTLNVTNADGTYLME